MLGVVRGRWSGKLLVRSHSELQLGRRATATIPARGLPSSLESPKRG
uniref:Uncharacterized protein n=1 Tax=Setaria italica TaxID=4555 RepID=K3Y4D3_SETIT